MPPKAVLTVNAPATVIILRLLNTQGNTNIAKSNKQLVE